MRRGDVSAGKDAHLPRRRSAAYVANEFAESDGRQVQPAGANTQPVVQRRDALLRASLRACVSPARPPGRRRATKPRRRPRHLPSAAAPLGRAGARGSGPASQGAAAGPSTGRGRSARSAAGATGLDDKSTCETPDRGPSPLDAGQGRRLRSSVCPKESRPSRSPPLRQQKGRGGYPRPQATDWLVFQTLGLRAAAVDSGAAPWQPRCHPPALGPER